MNPHASWGRRDALCRQEKRLPGSGPGTGSGKFPEAAAKIRQFFRQSPSFQSLCEDYRDCLAAWELWRRAAPGEAQAVCQSYAELLRELEEEVRQYLEHEEVSGSSR